MGQIQRFTVSEFLDGCTDTEKLIRDQHRDHIALASKLHVEFMALLQHEQPARILPKIMGSTAQVHFLSALRLATSGLSHAVYPVARTALESALYAFIMKGSKSAEAIWADRDADDASRRKCSKMFVARNGFALLDDVDSNLSGAASSWYEITISSGAHPNQGGVMSHINLGGAEQGANGWAIPHHYVYGVGSPMVCDAIHAAIRSGALAVGILGYAFDDAPRAREAIEMARAISQQSGKIYNETFGGQHGAE